MVNDLADRLRPVLLKLCRELRREVTELGVTGGQASLLWAIRRSPGIGVVELAADERMSRPAMSGYVARLERAGLVERIPDERDRRRHGLAVTARGDELLRAVRSRRTAWLAERLRRLAPDELEALERAVGPLGRLLEDGA